MPNLAHSQNFFKSDALVRKLIQKANISSEDHVIEIGAGKGIITDALANSAKKVIAIEYDSKLYEELLRKHQWNNVEYVHADFLKYPLPKKGSYKVFSNIPFQITADIVTKLTTADNSPEEMFLILQKEAAKKFCGLPFQKYEGLRAALLKPQYEMRILHNFAPMDFTPTPKVEIVLLHFKKRQMDMSPKEYLEYKDFVSFFYTAGRGNTARERLSIAFSPKQINRLAKEHHFDARQSYAMISAVQWERLYCYSQTGLDNKRKELMKFSYRKQLKQQNKLKKQHRTRIRSNYNAKLT